MKKYLVLSLAFVALSLTGPSAAFAATTPSLGAADTYAVLGSTYTNTSATTITGDVGFTTGPQVAPLGVHVHYGSGAPYSTAGTDQGLALTALSAGANANCDFTFAIGAVNLSTNTERGTSTTAGTYTPGVYCTGASSAASIGTAGIILNGAGTYIFRIFGALTSADNSVVTLTGASACDVFWTPEEATTLGANTTFFGNVIDDSGITVGDTTTWSGRALAFGGTVTTDTDTINNTCGPVPASLRVIKTVVNQGGGSTAASAFPVFVRDAGVDVLGSPTNGVAAPGTLYSLYAGTYVVSENPNSFTQSFSGDCNANGSVTLLAGGDETCTVTNTENVVASSGGGGGNNNNNNSVALLPSPLINIVKVPSRLIPFPFGGGAVTYSYTVTNPGVVALHDVVVTDNKCSPVSGPLGDANSNSLLDLSESWTYACVTNVPISTTNTATAVGQANGFTVTDFALATVLVAAPLLPNTGLPPEGQSIPWNMVLLAGVLVLVSTSAVAVLKKRKV